MNRTIAAHTVAFVATVALSVGCTGGLAPSSSLVCGDGTADRSACEIDPAAVGCPEGAAVRNARCTSEPGPTARLPVAPGTEVHIDVEELGLSLPVDAASPVLAARPGRVLVVDGDLVVVDHGDGTLARYAGVAAHVAPDDTVAQGQPLGVAANDRLGLRIHDLLGVDQRVAFVESDGAPVDGEHAVSANVEQAPVAVAWSTCPTDLFADAGIVLDPGQPCTRVAPTVTLRGRVTVPGAVAAVQLFDDEAYDLLCADPGTAFTVEVPWRELGYDRLHLVVAAADPATCTPIRTLTTGPELVGR